jgi:hypothetical protein
MKTTILTIATLLATVLGISNSTLAAAGKSEKVSAILTGPNTINKIEVHGNVELFLSDGTADNVKIYGNNHKGTALAPDQNGVLHISSYQSQKLVVWVTVSNLNNLSVYDNSDVRSFGILSAIELNVKLYNNASAQLNLDVYQAYINLNDHAKANLSGNVNEAELDYARSSFADTTNLVSAHLVKTENFERIAGNDL